MQSTRIGFGCLILLCCWCCPASAANPDDAAYFEQHIRPLLVTHCYKCHAENSKPLQGGLRLDSRRGWQTGGDSGPAIVPGKPADSLLMAAVRYDGLEMPPAGKLPEAELAKLEEWIRRGAYDPRDAAAPPAVKPGIDLVAGRQHWAFKPLAQVTPPNLQADWPQTPVDQFLFGQLLWAGIQPNKPVGKPQLIRRAYLDLIGLPPTPEQVAAFVNDSAPDAYAKVVDQLLASPHYGERWARHWLDVARFAESHGFEHDYDRPTAYHYRDFVIRALNEDLPYNTFVRWQLAGDEIEPNNPQALAATGYLAAGVHSTQITKNQVEKERYDELDDMVATFGTSLLGLTIGCARCHDHKFDPLPNQDYYRLLSTFTTTIRSEMEVDLAPAENRQLQQEYDAQLAAKRTALQEYEQEQLASKLVAWYAARPEKPDRAAWQTVDVPAVQSAVGTTYRKLPDGSFLATGRNPDNDMVTVSFQTAQQPLTAIRLEVLADDSLPKKGPGRAGNGNIALSNVELRIAPRDKSSAAKSVKLVQPRATFEQGGLPVAATIDADAKSAWAVDGQIGKAQAAVWELEAPVEFASGAQVTLVLSCEHSKAHNLGRFRVAFSTQAGPVELLAQAELQNAAELDASKGQTSEQTLAWFRPLDADWQKLNQAVGEALSKPFQPKLTKMLVSTEGLPAIRLHTQGDDFLPHTHFLKRGDVTQKQGIATQSFLQVLMNAPEGEAHWQQPPPPGARTSYRRTALANWVTDPEQGAGHLLARVIVNRLWQHHFGRGLVATSSDFGKQGEAPTHPELLDWLASELIRSGWRLKHIHKLLMTSAVYQLDSAPNATAERVDADNKWLWRWTPRRLEGEPLRDSLLAASGLLDQQMYGPGSLDEQHKRRAIYFTVKRSKLVSTLVLFDGPDALQGVAVRPRTTVAPQALLLLNHQLVRACSQHLAQQCQAAGKGDLAASVERAYQQTLCRAPTASERADALEFLQTQAATYPADTAQLKALTDFCQVLFALNEFAYLD